MATKIRTKLVKNLSPDELSACRRRTLRPASTLRMELDKIERYKNHEDLRNRWMIRKRDESRAFLLEDDERNLLAWAYVTPEGRGHQIMMFVHGRHRRKGYGTRLLTAAMRRYGSRLVVCPWDRKSDAFYAPYLNHNICRSW